MIDAPPTAAELAALYGRGKSGKSDFKVSAPSERQADGITFDSKAERDHYLNLRALMYQGAIAALQYEPKFIFNVDGVVVGTYKPDFTFIENGKLRCQDVKPWKLNKRGELKPYLRRGFKRTCKLMEACFGIIVEVV